MAASPLRRPALAPTAVTAVASVLAAWLAAACHGAATSGPDMPRCSAGMVLLPGAPGSDAGHVHPDIPVPAAYRDLRNPYPYVDPASARLGAPIYAAQCARCHGDDGRGCGPQAFALDPPPDDLWEANRLHVDPYLYWRIHDGGDLPAYGLRTSMPAFAGVLTDDAIWRVLTYVRVTFSD